jgi:leucyl aminopeptidase
MTRPIEIAFADPETADIAQRPGVLAIFAEADGKLDAAGRRVNRLTRGAVERATAAAAWGKLEEGQGIALAMPHGLAAETLLVVRLARRAGMLDARRAGAWIAKSAGSKEVTVIAQPRTAADMACGLALRAYDFDLYRKKKEGDEPPARKALVLVEGAEAVAAAAQADAARVEGVFFTRDLVNEPANVLTTTDFAARLAGMQEIGLDVEILEEEDLVKLGMRTLLGVAQGSETPARVVVMHWRGGGDAAPLALIGKGVVFDTGGISIKPAGGMEEMTMDMGGAGVVAGTMRALALRKAKANVVGIVGLVENMPDGKAQRPGDIVRSMKGDTVEVINTDAEGRLVLADLLWYAQDRFSPAAMVNLATLTGAIIIALGHDRAGVFSNDDALAGALQKAADAEGEGAWRMPLGKAYDKLLKSRLADMKNVGGRAAGSITAAQFLQRFVTDGMPWAHIDIAGVCLPPEETDMAPKGPSGWGVLTLDRLVRDRYEG